ncbi:MAG: protocatechuate 3,4-dioxygenase subunit alpha [Solirubrobacteraceae bacterium]
MIFASAAQTVGPYFAIGLPWPDGPQAVAPGTTGAITLRGVVYDGAGEPIPDYLLETWQADPAGRFADLWGYGGASELAGFRGFARVGHEVGDGSFELLTVKPGALRLASGAVAAPHIDVSLFARGLLHRCVTRFYFADEVAANCADPVLATVPPGRRETLLAQPVQGGYEIDIHLQGPGETVFFAL